MTTSYDKIFIRGMTVQMSVGVFDFEKEKTQRVIVDVEISVPRNKNWKQDEINTVLSYADVVKQIDDIAISGHINLVETFAERIAEAVLTHPAAIDVRVHVEKPDIFETIDGVGTEIFRTR